MKCFLLFTQLLSLLLVLTHALPYPCPSVSTTDVNGPAQFPSFPNNAVTSSRTFVENHWSEMASMARPPAYNQATATAQLNCPHRQSGLLNWHNPATWGSAGVPNASHASITIPANTKVLISGCSIDPTVVLPRITVPAGSELIFGDADIVLRTRGIEVRGALRAGSSTCRLKNSVTITLHGTRPNPQLVPAPSVKGIYVTTGGVLDLYGVRYYPTWSRLAATASPNDNVIYVQDQVNWRAGQQIVITTTELKDSRDFNRNEVLEIKSVARVAGKNIAEITVTTPIRFRHYGGSEYQAEVGLLSRNVMVQGDEQNSEPTDTENAVCYDNAKNFSSYPCPDKFLTGYGGHILIQDTGAGRLAGVRLYRMGQTNFLGRYPFHLHFVGQNGRNSSITDSVIHRSFFRCASIHSTHNSLVSENVAYDVIGHCYYLEDGVEENNTFSYNLGAHVHFLGNNQILSSNSLFFNGILPNFTESVNMILPADFSASPFYITNSFNSFLGNAASGGWSGFAFPNLPKPLKASAGTRLVPRDRPLTLFKGNSAHSTAYWWSVAGAIYLGGELAMDENKKLIYWPGRRIFNIRRTCSIDTSRYVNTGLNITYCPASQYYRTMRFEDNKVFLVNGRGMQHWGERAEVIRFECIDCFMSMNVFGKVWVDNLLTNCRSGGFAGLTKHSGCTARNNWECSNREVQSTNKFNGFQWYDTQQSHIVTNSIFKNCNAERCTTTPCPDDAPWTLLTHSDLRLPDMMQASMNISYVNVNMSKVLAFSTSLTDKTGNTVSGRLQNWLDMDGSIDGSRRGKTNLGSAWARNWWRMRNDCKLLNEMWFCPMTSADFVGSFAMWWNRTQQNSRIGVDWCLNDLSGAPCPLIGKVTHFGRTEGIDSLDLAYYAKVTGPVVYESGGWFIRFDSGTPKNLTFDNVQVFPKDKLLIALPYPAGTTFTIEARTAQWCSPSASRLCRFTLKPTTSVDAVLNGTGDLYYFNNGILYLRIVQQSDGSLGRGNTWIQRTVAELDPFQQAGITLIGRTFAGDYRITINASNCGSNSTFCDKTNAAVPQALKRPAP